MAYRPSLKRTRPPETVELNMTPVMNLMVCLIPLLLAGAKFTELALLQYLPPAESAVGGNGVAETPNEPDQNVPTEKLNLLINLIDTGIQVSVFQSVELGPYFYEVPLKLDGGYDWKTLTDSLASVKLNIVGVSTGRRTVFNELDSTYKEVDAYKYTDASEVSVTALGTVHFQTVINLMDACQSYVVEEYVAGERRQVAKELFPITILKQFQ
ncbi:MAG: biopolymer transporter ExbD [Calditrichota bacterium]